VHEALRVLSDETSLTIMELLDGKELSMQQISTSLDMPLSSTYRKVAILEQSGFIKKTKIIRKAEGMDESFYTLWVHEVSISYKNNTFSLSIKQKPIAEKIVRLWQKFKG
jgi:DNA-binding transcriptional ArsR family regulator